MLKNTISSKQNDKASKSLHGGDLFSSDPEGVSSEDISKLLITVV